MAKRHLKVTGDLGRIVFTVRETAISRSASRLIRSQGIRSPEHCVNRGKRSAFGCCLQSCWTRLPYQVRLASGSKKPGCSQYAGTSPSRTFMLKERSASRKQWRSTMSTASFTCHLTMPTKIRHPNSSGPRYCRLNISTKSLLSTFSQARGEEVARNIFPETTIVRPAPVFGYEDRLLHTLAGVTNLFTSNHLRQRFWPVHVSKVTSPCTWLFLNAQRLLISVQHCTACWKMTILHLKHMSYTDLRITRWQRSPSS